MRLDAEHLSTYRIFAEYRADRPELQLEKRAAPAMKAAGLDNAGLATETFQHDPALLLGRIVLARRPSDVLNNLLSRFLRCSGLLLIFAPVNVTMSQKLSLIQSTRSVR